MNDMRNPFSYGGVVGNGAFCNRLHEIEDLTEIIRSAGRCFMYAERRMGKTSLIQQTLGKLPRRQFLPVYVDLWPTDGSASFAVTTARAMTMAAETKTTKLLELGKLLFGKLRPSVTLDDSGKPSVEFGIEGSSATKADLLQVLVAPHELAERTGKTVVMVFDEFQQIDSYDSDLTERQLRSSIQSQRNVAYLFLGSRKHLLQSMFLEQSRPLYRSATHYPIGPIAVEHWLPFILSRFRKANKIIANEYIAEICELTEGHPFYTQHLCHLLWSRTATNKPVSSESLTQAVDELLERESHAYVTLWETLSKNEQRLLRGLAMATPPAKPFSADFTRTYGLRSASNSQRSAESLLTKDVIDRHESSFVIVDRFFKIWIRRLGRH